MKINSNHLMHGALILACASSFTGPSSAAKHDHSPTHRFLRSSGEPADDRNKAEPFPRVYTASVPDPRTGNDEGANFVAQVDLLEILDCQHANKYGNDETNCRIVFLVHNENELIELVAIVDSDKIESTRLANLNLEYDKPRTKLLVDGTSSNPSNELVNTRAEQPVSSIAGYSCFTNLAGSLAMMQDLVLQGNSIPNLSVSLLDIGDSYVKSRNPDDGHDIWALEITGNGVEAEGRSTVKGVFMALGGIHPREYAPPELLLHWAKGLIKAYGNDPDITSLLDHTSIHLVIQANPDGRYVAETTQMFQRKNLNTSSGSGQCSDSETGVDLNRNFPFRWGDPNGSSASPCQETYHGSGPASEPETKAIIEYASSLFPEGQRKEDPEAQVNDPYPEDAMGIFLDIHSFGEMIIWPWGFQNQETSNNNGLEALVNKYRHFNGYEFSGPGHGFLYPASGASDDWAYGTLGAAGMTFEIGNDFHQDCSYFADHILPDNLPALTYAAKNSRAPYSISQGPDIVSFTLSSQSAGNTTGGGVSITIEAMASDSAYSSTQFQTSLQGIKEIRVYVDAHPYDLDAMGNPPPYTVMQGINFGGTSSNVEGMTEIQTVPGRRSIFLQAVDTDGYIGPVSAFWVEVEVGSDDANGGNGTSDGNQSLCQDSDQLFLAFDRDEGKTIVQTCSWLSENMVRFEWLCSHIDIAQTCPSSCNACDLFN